MLRQLTGTRGALAELTIIVVGVLIALAVQNWNDSRLDRATEREYLDRLALDLAADTARFSFILDVSLQMRDALRHVRTVLEADPGAPIDTLRFIEDVVTAARFGWNTPLYFRTTYDDLISTGNLGLLQNAQLRNNLARYYRTTDDWRARMDSRRGDFAAVSFDVIPLISDPTQSPGYRFDPEGAEGQLSSIVEAVRRSRLPLLVTSEENLAEFLILAHQRLRPQAAELLAELERQ